MSTITSSGSVHPRQLAAPPIPAADPTPGHSARTPRVHYDGPSRPRDRSVRRVFLSGDEPKAQMARNDYRLPCPEVIVTTAELTLEDASGCGRSPLDARRVFADSPDSV